MNKKVIIIGAGGHGKVIADIIESNGNIVLGYLDDSAEGEINSHPIIGRTQDIPKLADNDTEFIVAIGNNSVRRQIMEAYDVHWHIAIHPAAVISKYADVGVGTVIMPNAVVNANALVGKGNIINTGATVDHDCIIGNYVHISPGAHIGGTVSIGEDCWICIGAAVINNIVICDNCIVGAGGVIVNDINEAGTYLGVPARRIK